MSRAFPGKKKPVETNNDPSTTGKESHETDTGEVHKIKAVLRYGRSGASVVDSENEIFTSKIPKPNGIKSDPKLNFSNIGHARPEAKDDLKQIAGIGPFIEEKLNTIGIYTYSQLSKMNDEEIDAITELIEFFPGRIKRDDWKGQAKNLLENSRSELN